MLPSNKAAKRVIRLVAAITLFCFISYDIVWAYPDFGRTTPTSNVVPLTHIKNVSPESFASATLANLDILNRTAFKTISLAAIQGYFEHILEAAPVKIKIKEDANVGCFLVPFTDNAMVRYFDPGMKNLPAIPTGFTPVKEYTVQEGPKGQKAKLVFQLLEKKEATPAAEEAKRVTAEMGDAEYLDVASAYLREKAPHLLRAFEYLKSLRQDHVISNFYVTGSFARGLLNVPASDIDFTMMFTTHYFNNLEAYNQKSKEIAERFKRISQKAGIELHVNFIPFGHEFEVDRDLNIVDTGLVRENQDQGILIKVTYCDASEEDFFPRLYSSIFKKFQAREPSEDNETGSRFQPMVPPANDGTLDLIILNDDVADTAFEKDGKSVTFPRERLLELKHMMSVARELKIESMARCRAPNGVVEEIVYPSDKNRIAVLTADLPDNTILNTHEYFSYPAITLANVKHALEAADINEIASSGVLPERLINSMRQFLEHMEQYRATISVFVPNVGERVDLTAAEIGDLGLFEAIVLFKSILPNVDYMATEWVAPINLVSDYEFGEGTVSQKARSVDSSELYISIHNHPLGHACPPSAIRRADGTTLGDIYVRGFFNGEINGLILDTERGEELFLLHEQDRSNEQAYLDMFGKFWGRRENILQDLRRVAMTPRSTDRGQDVQPMMSPDAQTDFIAARRKLERMLIQFLFECTYIQDISGRLKFFGTTKNREFAEMLQDGIDCMYENLAYLPSAVTTEVVSAIKENFSPLQKTPTIGVVKNCPFASVKDVNQNKVLFDWKWVQIFLLYKDHERFGRVVRRLVSERLFHEIPHARSEKAQTTRDIYYQTLITPELQEDIDAFFDEEIVKAERIADQTKARFNFLASQADRVRNNLEIDMAAVDRFVGGYEHGIVTMEGLYKTMVDKAADSDREKDDKFSRVDQILYDLVPGEGIYMAPDILLEYDYGQGNKGVVKGFVLEQGNDQEETLVIMSKAMPIISSFTKVEMDEVRRRLVPGSILLPESTISSGNVEHILKHEMLHRLIGSRDDLREVVEKAFLVVISNPVLRLRFDEVFKDTAYRVRMTAEEFWVQWAWNSTRKDELWEKLKSQVRVIAGFGTQVHQRQLLRAVNLIEEDLMPAVESRGRHIAEELVGNFERAVGAGIFPWHPGSGPGGIGLAGFNGNMFAQDKEASGERISRKKAIEKTALYARSLLARIEGLPEDVGPSDERRFRCLEHAVVLNFLLNKIGIESTVNHLFGVDEASHGGDVYHFCVRTSEGVYADAYPEGHQGRSEDSEKKVLVLASGEEGYELYSEYINILPEWMDTSELLEMAEVEEFVNIIDILIGMYAAEIEEFALDLKDSLMDDDQFGDQAFGMSPEFMDEEPEETQSGSPDSSRNCLSPEWWQRNLPEGIQIPDRWQGGKVSYLPHLTDIRLFAEELIANASSDERIVNFIMGLVEGKTGNTLSVRRIVLLTLANSHDLQAFDRKQVQEALKTTVTKEGTMLSRPALFVLCQLPSFTDESFIDELLSGRAKEMSRVSEFDEAVAREGFSDRGFRVQKMAIPLRFLKTLIKFKEEGASVCVGFAPDLNAHYGEDFLGLFLEEVVLARERVNVVGKMQMENSIPPGIAADRYIHSSIARKARASLEEAGSKESNIVKNPLIDKLIEAVGGPVLRSKGTDEESFWPKDAAPLIATRFGYVPFEDTQHVKGGELVSGYGKNGTFIIVSNPSARNVLDEIMPEDKTYYLPSGFLTLKHKGEFYYRGTSHIDVVMGSVPTAARGERPVMLIDPQYHQNIKGLSAYERLVKDDDVLFVDVPESERHLNPANFAILPKGEFIIPYAPETRSALIQAGVDPEYIRMLLEKYNSHLESLHVLGGSIGCLVGQVAGDVGGFAKHREEKGKVSKTGIFTSKIIKLLFFALTTSFIAGCRFDVGIPVDGGSSILLYGTAALLATMMVFFFENYWPRKLVPVEVKPLRMGSISEKLTGWQVLQMSKPNQKKQDKKRAKQKAREKAQRAKKAPSRNKSGLPKSLQGVSDEAGARWIEKLIKNDEGFVRETLERLGSENIDEFTSPKNIRVTVLSEGGEVKIYKVTLRSRKKQTAVFAVALGHISCEKEAAGAGKYRVKTEFENLKRANKVLPENVVRTGAYTEIEVQGGEHFPVFSMELLSGYDGMYFTYLIEDGTERVTSSVAARPLWQMEGEDFDKAVKETFKLQIKLFLELGEVFDIQIPNGDLMYPSQGSAEEIGPEFRCNAQLIFKTVAFDSSKPIKLTSARPGVNNDGAWLYPRLVGYAHIVKYSSDFSHGVADSGKAIPYQRATELFYQALCEVAPDEAREKMIEWCEGYLERYRDRVWNISAGFVRRFADDLKSGGTGVQQEDETFGMSPEFMDEDDSAARLESIKSVLGDANISGRIKDVLLSPVVLLTLYGSKPACTVDIVRDLSIEETERAAGIIEEKFQGEVKVLWNRREITRPSLAAFFGPEHAKVNFTDFLFFNVKEIRRIVRDNEDLFSTEEIELVEADAGVVELLSEMILRHGYGDTRNGLFFGYPDADARDLIRYKKLLTEAGYDDPMDVDIAERKVKASLRKILSEDDVKFVTDYYIKAILEDDEEHAAQMAEAEKIFGRIGVFWFTLRPEDTYVALEKYTEDLDRIASELVTDEDETFGMSPEFMDEDDKESVSGGSEFLYQKTLRKPSKVGKVEQKSGVRFFGAEFSVYEREFIGNKHHGQVEKIQLACNIDAATKHEIKEIGDASGRRIFESALDAEHVGHVPEVLAFATLYKIEDTLFVSGYASHAYSSMVDLAMGYREDSKTGGSPVDKYLDHYQDWSKVMLLAVHDYARERADVRRICIGDMDFQVAKSIHNWQISPPRRLFERLYVNLPGEFGYTEVGRAEAPDVFWVENIWCGSYWEMKLSQEPATEAGESFKRQTTPRDEGRTFGMSPEFMDEKKATLIELAERFARESQVHARAAWDEKDGPLQGAIRKLEHEIRWSQEKLATDKRSLLKKIFGREDLRQQRESLRKQIELRQLAIRKPPLDVFKEACRGVLDSQRLSRYLNDQMYFDGFWRQSIAGTKLEELMDVFYVTTSYWGWGGYDERKLSEPPSPGMVLNTLREAQGAIGRERVQLEDLAAVVMIKNGIAARAYHQYVGRRTRSLGPNAFNEIRLQEASQKDIRSIIETSRAVRGVINDIEELSVYLHPTLMVQLVQLVFLNQDLIDLTNEDQHALQRDILWALATVIYSNHYSVPTALSNMKDHERGKLHDYYGSHRQEQFEMTPAERSRFGRDYDLKTTLMATLYGLAVRVNMAQERLGEQRQPVTDGAANRVHAQKWAADVFPKLPEGVEVDDIWKAGFDYLIDQV